MVRCISNIKLKENGQEFKSRIDFSVGSGGIVLAYARYQNRNYRGFLRESNNTNICSVSCSIGNEKNLENLQKGKVTKVDCFSDITLVQKTLSIQLVERQQFFSLLELLYSAVLQLSPKMIFTDRLKTYQTLIPKNKHNTRKKNTTVIERYNLTLRIHLKRLSRKTICFSKNLKC